MDFEPVGPMHDPALPLDRPRGPTLVDVPHDRGDRHRVGLAVVVNEPALVVREARDAGRVGEQHNRAWFQGLKSSSESKPGLTTILIRVGTM